VHEDVLQRVIGEVAGLPGVSVRGICDSGLPGRGGNREFVVWFDRGGDEGPTPDTLKRLVRQVVVGGVDGA
jgi:hypothetical protein